MNKVVEDKKSSTDAYKETLLNDDNLLSAVSKETMKSYVESISQNEVQEILKEIQERRAYKNNNNRNKSSNKQTRKRNSNNNVISKELL